MKGLHAQAPSKRAHQVLKFIFQELEVDKMPMSALARKSGVNYRQIVKAMRGESDMKLSSVEALLNTVGYTMKPTMLAKEKKK